MRWEGREKGKEREKGRNTERAKENKEILAGKEIHREGERLTKGGGGGVKGRATKEGKKLLKVREGKRRKTERK